MTAPRVCRAASSRSDSQSFLAAPAGRPHADTAHPQERSRDTDDWPDSGRDRDSSRRRFAHSLATLARHAAATVLLLLGILFTVPAQAQEPTVPGAPTELMATADGETNNDLAWTAPADTGGAPITGYRIEVSSDGGNTWTNLMADTGLTDTAYSHTGLTHGDTRHYRVSAINSVGAGAVSNVADATAADTTPPRFVRTDSNTNVSTGGDHIVLAFNEALDDTTGQTPPASAFTVTADGSTVTVTEVKTFNTILGFYLRLFLSPVITKGQTVTVSYRDPTSSDDQAAIQDLVGNDAASFTDQAITNSSNVATPPTVLSETVSTALSGIDIHLNFDSSLDHAAGRWPPLSAFTVTADGGTVAVSSLFGVGALLRLVLADPITQGQTVTVSYRDPTEGDDGMALQDLAGNDVASFTVSVLNRSDRLPAPTNLTAMGVSDTQIDLSWEAPAGFAIGGYRIEVSTDGGMSWTDRVADTESTDTDYSHSGLTDGDTRHYRVSTINTFGNTGPPSNVASATTMATDTTPPAVLDSPALHTVTSSGVELRIAFTEALDDTPGQTPPASAFTVTANGSQVSVSAVSVAGNRVTLDLRATILRDQTVTVSYTDPTPSDDPAAVQDAAGNDAASFTDQTISNLSRLRRGPTNLRAIRRSFNWTDLSWEAPADFVPERYRVEGNSSAPSRWITLVNEVDDPTDTVFSHYDAVPDSLYAYRYRVWAVSSTVESVVSNTAAAGPDRVPPVLVPEHRDTLVFSDGTAISLEFDENVVDGPPWSAFTVTVDGIPVQQGRVTTAQDQIRLTGFESPIGGGRVVRVSYRDPTPGDDPAAIQDAAGNDAASFTDVVIKNGSRVLPAPTNLRATGIDDTRIGLAWNAPDLSGLVWPDHLPVAGIYGYKIEASADGGTTWTTLVSTDNRATSYVHSGLTQGDVRHYRVSAINVFVFPGLPSNVASAIASDTLAPGLKSVATNAAGTEVSLEFDTTLQSGTGQSAPAHAFTVTADGVAMAVGTATTGTDTVVLSGFSPAIKQGQTVTVSYRDLTEGDDAAAIQDLAGNDVPSATDVPVTNNSTLAPTAPGAPRNLQARARGATQIDLAWEPPDDSGGLAIEGYKIEVSTDGGATLTVLETDTGTPATEYAHPRLMNGDMRYYRVFAINAAGTGRASNAAIATTGSGPAVPANVGADRGDGSLSVTWDAVAGATEYTVQWTSGGDPFTRSRELTVTTNAATVPDLVNGTTYTLRVSAGNAQGDSEWSEPATGMPQVPAPETPENLTVTTGDTTLVVTWDAVPGAAEYTVQWTSGTEAFDPERQLTVTVNTATVPGLVNGTAYTLRVQAANAGGESGWSETATGTPTPLGVPGNLEVTAWDGRVAVCFDEVVGATEYTVQWRTDTEAYSEDRQKTVFETSETMDCGEGRLSTTVHRLANETVHWFRVRASNSWWDEGVQRKDSIWSAEVTATPTATPVAPANLVVMPGDGRLDVSWDAVEGADRYTVEWRQSGTVREREETTHAAALTGLVNGTTYSLRVKAANEVGEGPWSAPARGRPDPLGHPPEVSITLGAGPQVDGALSVRVTFSEAVRGFEDGDLTAGYVGGPGVVVRGFEEEQTGLVYSAMVPASQPGTLVISVGPGKATAVSDTQGNVLGALVVEVGASGNAVAVSGPVVTGVLMSAQSGSGRQNGFGTRSVAARGGSGSGGSVRVTVRFSEPVTVDLVGGTPVIGLRLGEREREAPYAGGADTETLTFVYTVTGEDGSVTGGSVTPDSLTLNGGTIRSWSGAEADLRHPGAALDGTGGDELPALTARFEAAPDAHDGAGTFTVRLVFSEPVAISYQTLRDESVSAAGGAVEAARRVEGRSDLWEITLTPASDEPVTLTLAADRACDTAGAICTADGRRLSNEAVLRVPGPAGDGPALTAQFEGMPEAHDGQSAFSFQVAFSEDIGISYQTLRDESFTVTGGTITRARRIDGRHDLWEITLNPDSREAVTITLPGGRACGTAGAVCTRGDRPRPLDNSPSSTVAGPPAASLTASFSDMPGEHTGEAFSFGLTFSEELDKDFSYRTLRDEAFAVTGGAVRKAKRRQSGSNLGWTITVEPDGDGAVAIRLPETTDCHAGGALCTGDGRPLSTSLSVTVAGPVGIAVADARVEEDAGALLAFVVTLSRAASRVVTVDYATADGTAQAGVDYTAASGTLTFPAGASSQTVEVAVLDDAHDEGEETLTLTLSNASAGRLTDGEATGTIKNRDPLPRALLARFGRTAAVHVVEHVEERIAAPRAPGFRGRFAGQELRPGMAREIARNVLSQLGASVGANPRGAGVHDPTAGAPAARAASLGTPERAGGGAGMATATGPDGGLTGGGLLQMGLGGGDLLTGSAFAMNRETRHGGILSFWSRGARSSFSGREGALSLGGDVRTTMVGADYATGPLVAGLSLSHSRGLGEYAGVAGGQVASSVTGLYPWLGYKATERVTVWGVAGYGAGGLLLTPQDGPALEAGLSMAMAAAGTRGELVAGGAGGFALAFKADALWVGTATDGVEGPAGRLAATAAAVTRFRTGLEGSRAYTLAGRLSLTPSVEVGLRHDGGDAETGAGMDVGAGLIVSDASSGLAVDVRVRTLLVHQAEGFRERGVAVSLSYNPTPSTPLGLVARVAPSWGGQATSGAEALWGQETMGGLAHGSLASGNRLDGEVGYGLPVGRRFVGTPTLGVGTSADGRDYRLGYRLGALGGAGTAFELGVDAQRRERPLQGDTDHAARARATLRW